jgi:hypothetical protein
LPDGNATKTRRPVRKTKVVNPARTNRCRRGSGTRCPTNRTTEPKPVGNQVNRPSKGFRRMAQRLQPSEIDQRPRSPSRGK